MSFYFIYIDRERINKVCFLFICNKCGKCCDSRISKRSCCACRVNARLDRDETFRVTKVVKDHEHELFPDLSRLMPAHRYVCNAQLPSMVELRTETEMPHYNHSFIKIDTENIHLY